MDGKYGRPPKRQRYRCIAPDGKFHSFTPVLPREMTPGGVCASCDTTVAAHKGPVVSRAYRHGLHLVADALVSVGRGVSYTSAAQRARVAAGREPLAGEGGGQMVAEWVDAWAPVILAKNADHGLVETLVLDSTDFSWTNRRTGQRRREFAVLIAYGYTAGGRRRVLAARANCTAQAADYLRLLVALNLTVPPLSVVADASGAITSAVQAMWPVARGPAPFMFACEHHLRMNAAKALKADNAHAPTGRWMRRLDTAFRRPEGWEEFRDACAPLGAAAVWVAANDRVVSAQVAARQGLPAHYSSAGVDAAAAKLRGLFEQRSFALRNAQRTNLLLGLAVAHLNNEDDALAYHRALREHSTKSGGQPAARQRSNRDSTRDPVTGKRISSLR